MSGAPDNSTRAPADEAERAFSAIHIEGAYPNFSEPPRSDHEIVEEIAAYQAGLEGWELVGFDLAGLARKAHGWYRAMRDCQCCDGAFQPAALASQARLGELRPRLVPA